jgi:hypothetical protein
MSDQDTSNKSKPAGQDTGQLSKEGSVAPIYFAVSPLKLSLMSICTMGIYDLYWFYKNWVLIKEREKSDIKPFWRAFFAYFYCFSFFKRVQTSEKDVLLSGSMSPGQMAAGWIIVMLLWRLPDPYWMISDLSFTFLLPIQMAVNKINESVAPGHHKNGNFTAWNIVGLVLGGLLSALILVGMFFPSE